MNDTYIILYLSTVPNSIRIKTVFGSGSTKFSILVPPNFRSENTNCPISSRETMVSRVVSRTMFPFPSYKLIILIAWSRCVCQFCPQIMGWHWPVPWQNVWQWKDRQRDSLPQSWLHHLGSSKSPWRLFSLSLSASVYTRLDCHLFVYLFTPRMVTDIASFPRKV